MARRKNMIKSRQNNLILLLNFPLSHLIHIYYNNVVVTSHTVNIFTLLDSDTFLLW